MLFSTYRSRNKRKYCEPEIEIKKENNYNPFNNKIIKNLILNIYFKIILKEIYENFKKNNFFFEICIYIDLIKLVDTRNYLGTYIVKNFINFINIFNEITYVLLLDFYKIYKNNSDVNFINFLEIIIKNKFFKIFLIPLNTPIKINCTFNLVYSNKLEYNFYNVIELINATLIKKDKKSILYKNFYIRVCNCKNKYMSYENVLVNINQFGNLNQNKRTQLYCPICFIKEYEEVEKKRQYKNFYILNFSFPKIIDDYNNKDEYSNIEILYNDINNKIDDIEIGKKYNLIVISIPNELNKNNIKGLRVGSLWLLNYKINKIKLNEKGMKTLNTNSSISLSTESFNHLIKSQNLNEMNEIINDILKLPRNNTFLNTICKITKLTLILICISNNFLKYMNLHSFAFDIFNKVNNNKWNNTLNNNISLPKFRPPHCFFMCLDETIIIELIKYCNYFCNIKLLNVKKDSFHILLTQKYDIIVININNLNNNEIKNLSEIMKNGIYKYDDCCLSVTATFWIYAIKQYIKNEQDFKMYINEKLIARFDFLFELGFEKEEDLIDEILNETDQIKVNTIDYYYDLNNKYSYLKKNNLYNFQFNEINDMAKSIVQKYFSMALDLSTLTIDHIAICEALCISVSILLGKKECDVEHAILALFLYDKFVSSTKNKLTQFDKNLLNRVINSHENKSFQNLINYFTSYLNATINL